MHWIRRHRRGRPPHPDVLTPAEWRVLELVREGMPNAEIAVRLGIAVPTVKSHITSILAKTGVANRYALAEWDGEPMEASRAALGRFSLGAPLAWMRDIASAGWVGKAAVVGAVALVSVATVVGIASLNAADPGGEVPADVEEPGSTLGVATPEPTATATPAAGGPDVDMGPQQGVWLVDLATGRITVLHEGNEHGHAQFEPGGETVSAMIRLGDREWRAVRFDLDGGVLEEHDDRILIHVSPDGASRHYHSMAPEDLPRGRLALEHAGEEIELAELSAYGVSFSPSGDRLIAGSGLPAEDRQVPFLYRVYAVETGTVLLRFESRMPEGTDGGELPRWSPSGRFIATSGMEGVTVHDTETGEAHPLGRGLARWSPVEDAILALDADGNLDVVRFPGVSHTRLADNTSTVAWHFGADGEYVYGVDWDARETTVIDLGTGTVVATWNVSPYTSPGFYPVRSTPDGPAAALDGPSEDCRGILLHHPALPGGERCIEGHSPRWSPDGRSLAYTWDRDILVLDIASGTSRVVASGMWPDAALARWNEAGTHLLVQWHWGGIGWEE